MSQMLQMYLHVKFGGHRCYANGNINSNVTSYTNISGKAELIASILHTERFSKSEIPVDNPKAISVSRKRTDVKISSSVYCLNILKRQEIPYF